MNHASDQHFVAYKLHLKYQGANLDRCLTDVGYQWCIGKCSPDKCSPIKCETGQLATKKKY